MEKYLFKDICSSELAQLVKQFKQRFHKFWFLTFLNIKNWFGSD